MFSEGETTGPPSPTAASTQRETAREVPKRRCARPGCTEFAIATLTYDYSGSAAWLDDLAAEAHPMTHDLCARHADRLSAPNGWVLHDRRQATPFLRRTA